MFNTLVVAVGLAMDSFGASIAIGGGLDRRRMITAALISSIVFGAFQAGMPLLGMLIGSASHSFISGIDHWVAFTLLTFIGLKTIFQPGVATDSRNTKSNKKFLSTIFCLAFATSIDALVVGMGLAVFGTSVWTTVGIIGIVTFTLTLLGIHLGHGRFNFLKDRSSFIGGFVLITIGIKILIDHQLV